MSYRDKSQGLAFAYTSLKTLTIKSNADGDPNLEKIRKNLDRLQYLHNKLYLTLEELASIDKKRKI